MNKLAERLGENKVLVIPLQSQFTVRAWTVLLEAARLEFAYVEFVAEDETFAAGPCVILSAPDAATLRATLDQDSVHLKGMFRAAGCPGRSNGRSPFAYLTKLLDSLLTTGHAGKTAA